MFSTSSFCNQFVYLLIFFSTVCKATLAEMLEVISKVDPKKTVDIGGYHLDVGRNDRKKTVQLSKSETYLTDLMETICKSIALSLPSPPLSLSPSLPKLQIQNKNDILILLFVLQTGDKLDDYAKARYKSNGALTIMKLTSPGGGMNPDMSLVDFVQDGDLNKSLKHFVSNNLMKLIRFSNYYYYY